MEDNNKVAGSGIVENKYVPPKNWDVLTADEKIERMRQIIKDHSSSIAYANRRITQLESVIEKHQHDDKGGLLMPYDRYATRGGVCELSACDSTPKSSGVYF